MIQPYQTRQVMNIAQNEPMIYNTKDRKAFRWLYYLATVAMGHSWTSHERTTLRILYRKYGVNKKSLLKKLEQLETAGATNLF